MNNFKNLKKDVQLATHNHVGTSALYKHRAFEAHLTSSKPTNIILRPASAAQLSAVCELVFSHSAEKGPW